MQKYCDNDQNQFHNLTEEQSGKYTTRQGEKGSGRRAEWRAERQAAWRTEDVYPSGGKSASGVGSNMVSGASTVRKRRKLNKSQRMQLKALAGLLGILLLLFLLLGGLLHSILRLNESPLPHLAEIPAFQFLKNVWVMEVAEDGVKVFLDGQEMTYPLSSGVTVPREAREQVADLLLYQGSVARIHSKTEKINGKVLAVSETGVELEGFGWYSFSQEVKGYRLYGQLAMCGPADLLVGYNFADFVLEEGKICGLLIAREETMEYIRVLLKSGNYESLFHEAVELSCDGDYLIRYDVTPDDTASGSAVPYQEELYSAGEICRIDRDSTYFQAGQRITVYPAALTGRLTLRSLSRTQGAPSYRGTLELVCTDEGILVINEVLLEEYLYSVVPSEMPASYPLEALKAQAVCARTYAYGYMLRAGYPAYGAHVDDSTSYQVYNNILEQEAATTAVKETYGQLLYAADGSTLASTYYYSTSCGIGSDASVWGTEPAGLEYLSPRPVNRELLEELRQGNVSQDLLSKADALRDEEAFRAFLRNPLETDYEAEEAWYRWEYTVPELDAERMLAQLQKRYEANPKRVLTLNGEGEYVSEPITELGGIQELSVSLRGAGGVAAELLIVTDKQTIKVLTEYNIRCILNDGKAEVLRQNGSQVSAPTLLPSAYFYLDEVRGEEGNVTGYVLHGGGYGHGVGMSQNGARHMAAEGCTASEILIFFYNGCMIKGQGAAGGS